MGIQDLNKLFEIHREIKKRNRFDPIIKKQKDIPYLVDQHLLDKNV